MVYSEKLVKRYRELHQESPDCLLLMQVGAFMQVMDENARSVATVTGLKLQMAGDVDAPVVLGGFPKSGLDAPTWANWSVRDTRWRLPYRMSQKIGACRKSSG